MNKRIKFPEIEQFRQLIKFVSDRTRYAGKNENGAIFDNSIKLPTLTFTGTVKLHGTNSGVTLSKNGKIYAQSRESILTVEDDNYGFASFVEKNEQSFRKLFDTLEFRDCDYITIFGEWCGSNIQKGVAINGLPKMFVIFDVKMSYDSDEKNNYFLDNDEIKHLRNEKILIYNIYDFETYTIDIDFENPALSQNKLVELTNEVEKQCPVGKAFGKEGIGEGIVWKSKAFNETIRFKVKGEKHSSSKVKTLAPVDTEKINSIKEFAKYSVTVSRLEQGLEKTFGEEEIDIKKLGDFLRWIVNDILKEERDTLEDNGLEPKDVNKEISNVARTWFLNKWNKI